MFILLHQGGFVIFSDCCYKEMPNGWCHFKNGQGYKDSHYEYSSSRCLALPKTELMNQGSVVRMLFQHLSYTAYCIMFIVGIKGIS